MFGKSLRFAVWLVCLVVFGAAAGLAQPAAEPDKTAEFAGLPVEKWVGKVFYVLPLEQSEKAKGYPFVLAKPSPELLAGQGSNVRAEWLEGRKLEVLAVELKAVDRSYGLINDYLVTFKELKDGTVLTGQAMGGQVPAVVLYEDLTEAQRYFTGKTVFSKRPTISVFQSDPAAIAVRVDEPLQVSAVIPGVTAAEPIWLVVTTPGGQQGFIAINYSNTNVYQGLWKRAKPWSTVILEQNPRELYAWDEAVWADINAGVVKAGMQPDQVRFMWDEPLVISIDATKGEQIWLYPSKLLRFNAGGLYSVEDR